MAGHCADQLHPLRRLVGHLIADLEQLLVLLRVLQGHGRMVGQFLQRRFVVLGEVASHAVDQLERAEQLAAPPAQRHAQQRARAETQLADRPGGRSPSGRPAR